jgi:hypothetical protein
MFCTAASAIQTGRAERRQVGAQYFLPIRVSDLLRKSTERQPARACAPAARYLQSGNPFLVACTN